MHLTCYQTTHIGGRESNQDSFGFIAKENWGCFIVADGLGGHYHGEIASQAITESLIKIAPHFVQTIEDNPIEGMRSFVLKAIEQAQEAVFKKHQKIDTQTTVAVAWVNQEHLITAHIGDSRVYRLNKQEVLWRTSDHSEVQALFEKGKISEDDFSDHPLQNQLLRSVCMYDLPEVDISLQSTLALNESLVLCTDGFWSGCNHEDLIKLSRNHGSTEKKVDTLISKFIQEQGDDCDNITIQVVKVEEPTVK